MPQDQVWFGEIVKAERKKRGLSQQVCASRVQAHLDIEQEANGIPEADWKTFSRSAWAKIEDNDKFPRVREETVQLVAVGLEADINEVMSWANYRPLEAHTEELGEQIGKRITILIKREGIARADLAMRLGVTEMRLRVWETGKALPDAKELMQLAVTLGCTTDYLIVGKEIVPVVHTSPAPPSDQQIEHLIEEVLGIRQLLAPLVAEKQEPA